MLRRGAVAGAPTLSIDLYSRETLLKPAETYRRIRQAGAVVWLPTHQLWVMGRYRDVRQLSHRTNMRTRLRESNR